MSTVKNIEMDVNRQIEFPGVSKDDLKNSFRILAEAGQITRRERTWGLQGEASAFMEASARVIVDAFLFSITLLAIVGGVLLLWGGRETLIGFFRALFG